MAAGLVAVTGATGFLGRHLVRELATSGWTVRILARRDVIHPLWRDLEVEVVLGDLADAGALDRALKQIESYPPLVFAGEARTLLASLGQVANGNAFGLLWH